MVSKKCDFQDNFALNPKMNKSLPDENEISVINAAEFPAKEDLLTLSFFNINI